MALAPAGRALFVVVVGRGRELLLVGLWFEFRGRAAFAFELEGRAAFVLRLAAPPPFVFPPRLLALAFAPAFELAEPFAFALPFAFRLVFRRRFAFVF